MINDMLLGDNHACAGKPNISKTAPSSQESLRIGNTGRWFAWGFPSPWKPLPDSDPMLWKQSVSLLPLVSGTPWTFQRWRPCGLDISTGEDVSGLISHETRDPNRAMSVCHIKPNKEPIHKSPVELMCFAFLIKKWTGRLFAQVAGMRHRTWAQGPRVPFIAKRNLPSVDGEPFKSGGHPACLPGGLLFKNTRLLRTRCQDKRGGDKSVCDYVLAVTSKYLFTVLVE